MLEDAGRFSNTDGFPSRSERIDRVALGRGRWELIIMPYSQTSKRHSSSTQTHVFAVPPGITPSEQTDGVTSFIPSSVVQVRSSVSLVNARTIPFPPLPAGATRERLSTLIMRSFAPKTQTRDFQYTCAV